MRQQLSTGNGRERERGEKKGIKKTTVGGGGEGEGINSYLPALEEVESRADVGNPVDPLELLALLTRLEGKDTIATKGVFLAQKKEKMRRTT